MYEETQEFCEYAAEEIASIINGVAEDTTNEASVWYSQRVSAGERGDADFLVLDVFPHGIYIQEGHVTGQDTMALKGFARLHGMECLITDAEE